MLKKVLIGVGIALVAGIVVKVLDDRKTKYAEVKIDENGEIKEESEDEEEGEEEEEQTTQDKISAYVEKMVDWIILHEKEARAFKIVTGVMVSVFTLRKAVKTNDFQNDVLKTLNEISKTRFDEGGTFARRELSDVLREIGPGESALLVDRFDNGKLYKVSRYEEETAA